MTDERDPLLAAAEALADGELVETESGTLEDGLDPDQRKVVANLRRLAELQVAFRAGGDGERPGGESFQRFRWGHLEILEPIGSGSFGEVFRAFDSVLQRDVALKLRREDAGAGAAAREFIQEARRLARVRHRGVLAVHGADVHDGRVGLWCDLLDGETLEEALRRREFSSAEVLEIALALASALEAVHGAGLVHGDVKASNVMLRENGRPVLMDFGAGNDLSSGGSDWRGGSPLSMAPELFDDPSPSPACDLYALGVLLHRLATGRYPVEAETFEELRDLHRRRGRLPLRLPLLRTVDSGLARLIARLLSPIARERPTAEELVALLTRLREAPARRRRRLMAAAVFVSLTAGFVAAVLGFLVSRRSERAAVDARLEAEATSDFLSEVLAAPRGTEDGANVRVIDTLADAAEEADRRFADRPVLRARVLTTVARTYQGLNRCEEAVPLYERAVSLFEERLGRTSPHRIGALLELSTCQAELGLDASPVSLQRAAEAADELPPGHDLRVRSLVFQGRAAMRAGDWQRARPLLEAALAQRPEGGGGDLERDLALAELAELDLREGQYEEARRGFEEVVAFRLERYGERNVSTLHAYTLLGETLDRMGLPAEAEPTLRRALAVARDLMGTESSHLVHVGSALANQLYSLGRVEEALALNREMLEIAAQRGDDDDPMALNLTMNIANQLKDLGQIAEAEALYRRCILLATGEGADQLTPFIARYNLAELLYQQGRPREARELAVAARALLRGLGERHLFVLVSEAMIGASDVALGRVRDGRERIERQLALAREALGPEHPNTLEIQTAFAEALWASGEQEEARKLAEQTLEQRTRVLGAEHFRTRESAELLARWQSPSA